MGRLSGRGGLGVGWRLVRNGPQQADDSTQATEATKATQATRPQVEWGVACRARAFTVVALALSVLAFAAGAAAQAAAGAGITRRLTTIDALRQFPGYYHLQNVVLRGEFAEDGTTISFRADDNQIRTVMADGVRTTGGAVEIRGQLIDVGRLEPSDPRVGPPSEGRDADRWPRPGEELFVRVTAVASAQPVIGLSVRALALEPWRYDGQKVTVLGNFRGRNLFGDLPGAPGKSRYDFVIRGAEGAVWVAGVQPRGRGFDLDIDRRVDSDKWLEVSGILVHERGLVRIDATQLTLAKAPQITEAAPEEPEAPPPPPPPLEVVFSSPSDGEVDVAPGDPIRIQFSRGLDPKALAGAIRVSYVGPSEVTPPAFQTNYDAANRAITLRFAQPLESFRTVRVEVLEALKAFDGGIAKPWTITFSLGR